MKILRGMPEQISIPHRYAKNIETKRGVKYLVEFQFLIGTLKTSLALILLYHTYYFNSS